MISPEAVQAALDARNKHIDGCQLYLASEAMQAALAAAFPIMLREVAQDTKMLNKIAEASGGFWTGQICSILSATADSFSEGDG